MFTIFHLTRALSRASTPKNYEIFNQVELSSHNMSMPNNFLDHVLILYENGPSILKLNLVLLHRNGLEDQKKYPKGKCKNKK
jgi:hypothetical protein